MPPERAEHIVYERSALTAVLLGQTGFPHGAPPAASELAAWADKRLAGPRLSEVESHIAHDPAVFARAVQGLKARAPQRAPSLLAAAARRLGAALRGPLPALGAGLAAIALAVVFLGDLPGPGDAALGGRSMPEPALRGSPDAPTDWRVVAFRAGYWQQEAAVAADRAEDRADAFGCVDEEGCAAQVQQLVRFGELLAHLNAACASGLDTQERVQLAGELGEVDAAIAGSLELLPWRNYVHLLAADLQTGAAGACERGAALRELLIAD